jgi:nucleotide-binding universal stress UspA family protein
MTIDVILVATDFEPAAQAALDFAIELARPLGARIVLAHVFDLPLVGLPDATLMVGAETAARLSDEAQQSLDLELARVKDRGVRIDGVLHQGDPRDGVGEVAATEKAKLIVVGSHGRRGVVRALLGSIAEEVVRRSVVPVTVVHKAH